MSLFAGIAKLANAVGITIPFSHYRAEVVPGVLWRGSRPDASEIYELQVLGIKSVINLEAEHVDPRLPFPAQHLAIFDGTAPTQEQIGYALAWLDDPKHLPCYVHCRAGIGRTGCIVACYRIKHGMAVDRALAEAATFGSMSNDQIDAVIEYARRQA